MCFKTCPWCSRRSIHWISDTIVTSNTIPPRQWHIIRKCLLCPLPLHNMLVCIFHSVGFKFLTCKTKKINLYFITKSLTTAFYPLNCFISWQSTLIGSLAVAAPEYKQQWGRHWLWCRIANHTHIYCDIFGQLH